MGLGGTVEERIAGSLVEQAVEGFILADLLCDASLLDRVPTSFQNLLTTPLQVGGDAKAVLRTRGSFADGQCVKGGTNVVVVTHGFEVERGDLHTALADLLDQAIRLQECKSLLNRLAGDAEARGELFLHQMDGMWPSQISSTIAS